LRRKSADLISRSPAVRFRLQPLEVGRRRLSSFGRSSEEEHPAVNRSCGGSSPPARAYRGQGLMESRLPWEQESPSSTLGTPTGTWGLDVVGGMRVLQTRWMGSSPIVSTILPLPWPNGAGASFLNSSMQVRVLPAAS